MPDCGGFGTTPARFARSPLLTQEGILLPLTSGGMTRLQMRLLC